MGKYRAIKRDPDTYDKEKDIIERKDIKPKRIELSLHKLFKSLRL